MKTKLLFKQLMLVMLQCFAFTTLYAQVTCSQAFTYTGADQTFTVPPNVYQITVKLWGAGGAGGNYVFNDIGGGGGFATATLNVNPGEQYIIIVGGAGLPGAGAGAYGGGGAKANGAGGRGGGRSGLRNALSVELITAGGGGGGGGGNAEDVNGKGIARGGAGGGLTGEPSFWIPYNGNPGTQTEGGAGGAWPVDNLPHGSQPGSQFVGGNTIAIENGYNGSGGGGYYGGGSGTDIGDGGGGGGSSFIPAGGNTIGGTDDVPGNITDPDYADNAGYGGAKATAGNAGRVVVLWSNIFYRDADNDNYGDPNNTIIACTAPAGYVTDNTDCDDSKASVHPNATEICNGIDDNCNGQIDEGVQMAVSAGADENSYFGFGPDQCVKKTVNVTGGIAPYTYNWTLDRPLMTNVITASGDETLTGANASIATICLLDTAELCVRVTDVNGCIATDCVTIFAEDVRCFAGSSGNEKVKICHMGKTICVDSNAVEAHIAHGDYLGKCLTASSNSSLVTSAKLAFKLYPNPSKGNITLSYNFDSPGMADLKVYDIAGRIVVARSFMIPAGNNTLKLNLAHLQTGIYFLEFTSGRQQNRIRFMIE
jgi:hypothetical protein